jgi:hypothetical protein
MNTTSWKQPLKIPKALPVCRIIQSMSAGVRFGTAMMELS